MVNINTLQIDTLVKQIDVSISTTEGKIFTKVLAWKAEDFKDYEKALDLSSLLSAVDNVENFSIYPEENLGVETITGLWFFEFETNEETETDSCSVNNNTGVGVVSNLIPYFDSITDKLLSIDINGCDPTFTPDCTECQQGVTNIFYVNSLLTSLKYTTQNGYYEEAIKIQKTLEEILEVCNSCPNYTDTLLINGLGFATINNTITSTFTS